MEVEAIKKEIVILAGGTGLIGKALRKVLEQNAIEVRVLTRSASEHSKNLYHWNPTLEEIDKEVFEGVSAIINLCGAGIADSRWTAARKKELLDSRIEPARFLARFKSEMPQLEHYISASGINCYGYENSTKTYTETDEYGSDYLSQLVKKWEAAADEFNTHCLVTSLRISMVLTPDGGALKKMNLPIKLGIGSPIGSGKQWMPWIHIDDLNAAFLHVLRNKIPGKINVCSEVLDNKTFMRAFAKTLNKPFFFPNVPAFVMKLIFGEMSSVLLNGVQVSNEKLLDSGYTLKYPCLKEAFFDLYG